MTNIKRYYLFFSTTVNYSEHYDRFCPVNFTGLNISDSDFITIYLCEGRKARPTPMDLRSIPVEVHAFESHPSHFVVAGNSFYLITTVAMQPEPGLYQKTASERHFALFSCTKRI
jgi:hypothetical protein